MAARVDYAFTAWRSDALSTLTVFDGRRGKSPRLELKFAGAGAATPMVWRATACST